MAVENVTSPDGFQGTRSRQASAFARLYESVLRNRANENGVAGGTSGNTARNAARPAQSDDTDNLNYIASLHENVDTLRGEILARVIQTAAEAGTGTDVRQVTDDITRLSVRLDKLRRKLENEQTRLSGKLVDITI